MSQNHVPQAIEHIRGLIRDDLTEDEVERLFEPLYKALGYKSVGGDIRLKRPGASGIPDALLLDSDDSIHVVVELKNPRERLEDHEQQLVDYVRDLRAPYGLLSNGRRLSLYSRIGVSVTKTVEVTLDGGEDTSLLEPLSKREIDITDFQAVSRLLERALSDGLPLSDLGDLPSQEFLRTFSIANMDSPFSKLLSATQDLANDLLSRPDKRAFVRGAFDFWSKVYARSMEPGDTPSLWRPYLRTPTSASVRVFMYSLETTYVIAARLILAKVIQDHDIDRHLTSHHLVDKLSARLQASRGVRDQRVSVETYVDTGIELFNDYSKSLFSSIYAQDLFDWWREFRDAGDEVSERFSHALANLMLAVARFDFSALRGDLLGELYQHYFDAETRKALGEFYTPPEVVEFILDEVGYEGQGRLLDPAAGSGTFLVAALRRYLARNAHLDEELLLRGITDDFQIVGFDVNPFAVMMAQINFAAHLVAPYARVVSRDSSFLLRRLPIVRTDSLRLEVLEGEVAKQSGLQTGIAFTERDITVQVELPVRQPSPPLPVRVTVPRPETARNDGVVRNDREWLVALQSLFAAVEVLSQAYDAGRPLPDVKEVLATHLARTFQKAEGITTYLSEYADMLWAVLLDLKERHGDGRFLKTLEDLVIGLVLKHYFSYDFVVGNPPYVRIQNIPDIQRKYWEGRYEWARGKFDLYVPFLERAFSPNHAWLGEAGTLGFILPNRIRTADYAATARRNIESLATISTIVDFGAVNFSPTEGDERTRLFKDALVYPLVLIASKGSPPPNADFAAVRLYPKPVPASSAEAIETISKVLKSVDGHRSTICVGAHEYGDAFRVQLDQLSSRGWFLMPDDEQAVFNHLEAIGTSMDSSLPKSEKGAFRRLLSYTKTDSGGFYGFITGRDDVFIVEALEDPRVAQDGTVLVRSAFKPKGFRVELDALRPFLFGRDIGRWSVEWRGTHVIFPYLADKQSYTLIPSREYPNYARPGLPFMEDRFPLLAKYLKSAEKLLRGRVSNRYSRKSSRAHQWYELYQPSYIDLIGEPRVLLQILSRHGSAVVDSHTFAFQAGGSGGGIYGILPAAQSMLFPLAGLINSKIADFYLLQTSWVHSNAYYSWADRVIKWLPIPESVEKLSSVSSELQAIEIEADQLSSAIDAFPASITEYMASKKARPEVDELSRLGEFRRLAANLDIRRRNVVEEAGSVEVSLGHGRMRMDAETWHLVDAYWKRNPIMSRSALLQLELPVRSADKVAYLEYLSRWERSLADVLEQQTTLQAKLERQVIELYGFDSLPEAEEVLDRFLRHFQDM